MVEQGLARLGRVALRVTAGQETLVPPVDIQLPPVHCRRRRGVRHLPQYRDPDPATGQDQGCRPGGALHIHDPGDEPGGRGSSKYLGGGVHHHVGAGHGPRLASADRLPFVAPVRRPSTSVIAWSAA